MATFVALESQSRDVLIVQEEGTDWPSGFKPLVIGMTESEAEAAVRRGAFDLRRRTRPVVVASDAYWRA